MSRRGHTVARLQLRDVPVVARACITALACIAAPAFVAGCGTAISFTQVQAPPRPLAPRPVESVEVFTSSPPPCAHVDVGILEAEQESENSFDGTARMLQKLRREAAALGCDAIFVGSIGEHAHSALLDWHRTVSTKTIEATCIVYSDSPGEPVAGTSGPSMLTCGALAAPPGEPAGPQPAAAASRP